MLGHMASAAFASSYDTPTWRNTEILSAAFCTFRRFLALSDRATPPRPLICAMRLRAKAAMPQFPARLVASSGMKLFTANLWSNGVGHFPNASVGGPPWRTCTWPGRKRGGHACGRHTIGKRLKV